MIKNCVGCQYCIISRDKPNPKYLHFACGYLFAEDGHGNKIKFVGKYSVGTKYIHPPEWCFIKS